MYGLTVQHLSEKQTSVHLSTLHVFFRVFPSIDFGLKSQNKKLVFPTPWVSSCRPEGANLPLQSRPAPGGFVCSAKLTKTSRDDWRLRWDTHLQMGSNGYCPHLSFWDGKYGHVAQNLAAAAPFCLGKITTSQQSLERHVVIWCDSCVPWSDNLGATWVCHFIFKQTGNGHGYAILGYRGNELGLFRQNRSSGSNPLPWSTLRHRPQKRWKWVWIKTTVRL